MSDFWKSDTYAIVKAMKARGNLPGLITSWKQAVEHWAELPEYAGHSDAKAVRSWLPLWQVRPFYTADELVPLWPMLALAVGWSDRPPPISRSAARLENELNFAGLPSFLWGGKKYYVVERVHHWKDQVRQGNWQEINDALA